ncbi:putative taurine catabolism dioxygenase TauD [Diplogelasinospora grovesii]|uniref:Taurine catabolism dioxygenase TauD n=1 Tax=Diplogelasinospora grovesii TaxID=303347 RepID=A0AAN6MWQ9_9PEZI|nr:putative taurine catabolism dioxygenase TauD [Diplogelasinospora grovesii]
MASNTSEAPEAYYSQGLRARFQTDGIRAEQAALAAKAEAYADIAYEVDETKYLARSEARVKAGGLPTSVPAGWPTALKGPLVWTSNDFPEENEYVYTLTNDDKAELLEALKHFKEHGLDGNKVSKETFPLPKLGKELDKVCQDVYEGRGFSIVRGLKPEDYELEDLTVIYLGISSYVAERRGKQDQRGSMLIHVIKRGDQTDDQYSEDKPFHTDTVTDCLCLFTQSLAEVGGRSVVASAWTVYNELAATRPDLIHTLAAPDWPFDTYGREPPYYKRALQYWHQDKLITSFSRRLLVGHLPFEPRTPGIPGLTEAQAEALDAVHFIARKHEIKPRMEKGDLRFINNMALLHRREAFENSGDTKRHLVRIWLNNEDMCWKLPAPLQLAWARVFDDEGRGEHWDIAPVVQNGKIMRIGGSCD